MPCPHWAFKSSLQIGGLHLFHAYFAFFGNSVMSQHPVLHDYTRGTHQSGWGIIHFEFLYGDTVKISAFGLKRDVPHRTLEEAYLLPGEELVISMPDGEVLYEIVKIRYRGDPYDLYEAEIKYVQHLTGMKIVGQAFDTKKHARQLEWSQRRENEQSDAQ
ncbi:MAG: hypothetical protein ACAH88_17230 [Roseimicrobium sp.]